MNFKSQKPKIKNLREREEGFSVYLMGANEERVKNLRKKEQIERNKKQMTNSKSANRKQWDDNKLDYKTISKMILEEKSFKDLNQVNTFKDNSNPIHHIASKESLINVEEMLSNIKKVTNNLKKLGREIPGKTSISPDKDKRRRNWGEPKYHSNQKSIINSQNIINMPNSTNKTIFSKDVPGVIVYPKEYNGSVERNNNNEFLPKKNLRIEIDEENYNNERNSNNVFSNIIKLSTPNKSNSFASLNFRSGSLTHLETNKLKPFENYDDEENFNLINFLNMSGSLPHSKDNNTHTNSSLNLLKNSESSLTVTRSKDTNREKKKLQYADLKDSLERNKKSETENNLYKEPAFGSFHCVNTNKTLNDMLVMENLNYHSNNMNNSSYSSNEKNPINQRNNFNIIKQSQNPDNFDSFNFKKEQENNTHYENKNSSVNHLENFYLNNLENKYNTKEKKNNLRTNSNNRINPNERPFSSIVNISKIRRENEKNNNFNNYKIKNKNLLNIYTNYDNKNESNLNSLTSIPNIQFIYKSPQNKNRPSSHIQKTKTVNKILSKDTNSLGTKNAYQNNMTNTKTNIPILSNLNHYQNIIAERFTSRDGISSNMNRGEVNYTSMNFSNSYKNKKESNNTNNVASHYPLVSNILKLKSNNLKNKNNFSSSVNNMNPNKNSSKVSSSNANNTINSLNTLNTINSSNNRTSFIKKKIDLLSKIEQLDDKKLHKLARVVEELTKDEEEMPELSILNNPKKSNKNIQNMIFSNIQDKLNINYIKADSVNLGNININLNKVDSKKTSFSSLKAGGTSNGEDTQHENKKETHLKENKLKSSKKSETPSTEEKNRQSSNLSSNSVNKPNIKPSVKAIYNSANTLNPFKRNPKSPTNNSINNEKLKEIKIISLVFLSNWGHESKIGINKIELLDKDNNHIDVIKFLCHNMNEGLDKVINKKRNKANLIDEFDNYRNEDKLHNYISLYTPENKKLQRIDLFVDREVAKISINNFNDTENYQIGVKNIEIYESDASEILLEEKNLKWKGLIKNILEEDTQTIILLDSREKKLDMSNLLESSFGQEQELLIYDNSYKQKSMSNNRSDSELLQEDLNCHEDDLQVKSGINVPVMSARNFNNLNKINEDSSLDGSTSNNILRTSIGKNCPGKNFNNILSVAVMNSSPITRNRKSNKLNKLNAKSLYSLNSLENSMNSMSISRIKLVLSSNWGDPNYIGLTGLQFYDEEKQTINIDRAKTIGAMPKDINTVYQNGDPRIFENIFNNCNESTDEYNMWLTTFDQHSPSYIELSFENKVKISGLKIWNYNIPNQLERGVRTIDIIMDENYEKKRTIYLRKGVGYEEIDYSQIFDIKNYKEFSLSELEKNMYLTFKPASLMFTQDYETPYLPMGFNFKLILNSNWGNSNYIGLDMIQFYNSIGENIIKNLKPKILLLQEESEFLDKIINEKPWKISYKNISTVEESTLDDSLNNTFSNFNRIKSTIKQNIIYILFDQPISLSCIVFKNLSQDIDASLKDLSIFCDENLIYQGTIRKNENLINNLAYTYILFTSETDNLPGFSNDYLTDDLLKNEYIQHGEEGVS